MNSSLVRLYLLADNHRYLVALSRDPILDAKYYLENKIILEGETRLFFLTGELPIGLSYYLLEEVSTEIEQVGSELNKVNFTSRFFSLFFDFDVLGQVIEQKLTRLKKILKKFKLQDKLDGSQVDLEDIDSCILPEDVEWQQVYRVIQGRKLYYSEIQELLRQNRVIVRDLDRVLSYLKLLKKLDMVPALKYDQARMVCQRCGNSKDVVEIECNYCGFDDYYCPECLLMGESRSCRELYLIPAAIVSTELNFVEPNYSFELTSLQAEVSNKLIDFLGEEYRQALVWAVCGAGKTEVSFAIIADILSQGGKVLFAIPRKDVVVELAERLKSAFPQIKVKALYGGSLFKYQWADLVVATTHQVLKYYQAFDLVILDEMDAFPYQGDPILKQAVQDAKKPQGKLVYMTATVSDQQLAGLKYDNTKLIKLSARYHGYPLPEPQLISAKLEYDQTKEEIEIPDILIEKLSVSINEDLAQVFLFLPSKSLVRLLTEYLKKIFPKVNGQSWVEGSHSEDPNRDEKREAFLAGDFPILVSTTIMERGVTVENANVIVLFADWEYVFSEDALIQMAGRAGRSLKYPEGRVWFIGEEISSEMKKAQRKIRMLNEEAAEKGYLKGSEEQ